MKSLFAALILGFALASGTASAQFSEAELVDLGEAYARAINQLDVAALDELMSAQHVAQRIADIVGDSAIEREQLLRSFKDAVPTINRRILTELDRQNAVAVFLRVHEFDDMRGPLVRYSVGDGYNYLLLLPVRPARTDRGTKVGDIYYATSGELLSESIGISTKLLTSPSETFLGKIFGTSVVNRDLANLFEQVGKLRQRNRLQEAYDLFNELEGATRNHRLILMNTIQIASQIDERLYRRELRRLATHHKDDPRAAFTLLDHYFYENDLDAAMSIIDVMEASYGEDAVLNVFRANVEFARDRTDEALGYAERAVQLEPDNEDAQWTLLNVLVQSGKFAESVQVLEVLESDFGYAFTRADFEIEPLYADLMESGEFREWIGGR